MRDSACRWFVVKKAKIFWRYVKRFWISRVWENVESWLVYTNKLFWIAQLCFSTNMIKQSASIFSLLLRLSTVIIFLSLEIKKSLTVLFILQLRNIVE